LIVDGLIILGWRWAK